MNPTQAKPTETMTMTNPSTAPTLRAAADLVSSVAYLQRVSIRKRDDSRAKLTRELGHLIDAAQREIARLDADFDLDRSALRNICDTRAIHEAVADVREAEVMAAAVVELIVESDVEEPYEPAGCPAR